MTQQNLNEEKNKTSRMWRFCQHSAMIAKILGNLKMMTIPFATNGFELYMATNPKERLFKGKHVLNKETTWIYYLNLKEKKIPYDKISKSVTHNEFNGSGQNGNL